MNEYWIAISSALVGGVAGYLASRFQAHFELKRRRQAIATALLIDLHALEGMLEAIEDWGVGYSAQRVRPRMDVLERVADYVDVLPHEAVQWLLAVNANVRQVEERLERYKAQGAGELTDERLIKRFFWLAGVLARNTQQVVDTAREHLVKAGGLPIPSFPTRVSHYPDLPPLSERVVRNRELKAAQQSAESEITRDKPATLDR